MIRFSLVLHIVLVKKCNDNYIKKNHEYPIKFSLKKNRVLRYIKRDRLYSFSNAKNDANVSAVGYFN